MNTLFKGLNCDSKYPQPQRKDEVVQNTEKLLHELGADEKCVKHFNTITDTHSTSGAMDAKYSAGLLGMWGGASLSANWQTGGTKIDDAMSETGCGTLMANTKQIFDGMRDINCSLNNVSAESSITTSTKAKVTIKVTMSDALYNVESLRLTNLKREQFAQLVALAKAGVQSGPLVKDLARESQKTLQLLDNLGKLEIKDTQIEVEAGTKIKTITTIDATVKNKIQKNLDKITKAAAEMKLTQNAGKNAGSPSITSLIDTKISNLDESEQINIDQQVTSTNVNVDTLGGIVIEAPKQIVISGAKIGSNVAIDIVTSTLTSKAIESGTRIARALMTEATTTADVHTKSKGLAELQEELGKTNEAAIRAQNEGLAMITGSGSLKNMMMYACAACVIVSALYMMSMAGKDDADNEESGDDDDSTPPVPQGDSIPPVGILVKQNNFQETFRGTTSIRHYLRSIMKIMIGSNVKIGSVVWMVVCSGWLLSNVLHGWSWIPPVLSFFVGVLFIVGVCVWRVNCKLPAKT